MLQGAKKIQIFFISCIALAILSSCDQKFDRNADDGRSTPSFKKTVVELNPEVTKSADIQAFASNLKYKVWAISEVKKTQTGFRVQMSISQPPTKEEAEKGLSISDTKIELTTIHENGVNDYLGQKSMNTGEKLKLLARCSTSSCDRYEAILNVYIGSQLMFQNVIVAFKSDCKFYSASTNANEGDVFVDSLNSVRKKYNVSPSISRCQ